MEEKKICGLECRLQVKQHGLFLASPLEGKYCIISNPSRDSGLHLPCFLQHVCQQHLPLSGPTRADDRHTMPARSPPVCGIPSRAIGLPGIMFATLGVSPESHLGPNPYYPSKSYKHTLGSNLQSTFMEHLVCCLLTDLFLSQLLTLTIRTLPLCKQCCSTQPIIKIP